MYRLGPLHYSTQFGIGVDLAELLGGRMASAESGSVSRGMAYRERCPLSSRLRGLGERRELPQRGQKRSPGRKRILAYFEGHRTLIFVPIWQNLGGGQFALAFPAPNSGGTCPPCPPVIYAHAVWAVTVCHLYLLSNRTRSTQESYTRCSAIAERPRCRMRYSFCQK